MKQRFAFLYAITLLALVAQQSLIAANTDEEQKLIAVLQSGASLAEKDAACARLKFIGTARCVPALSTLLGDEQLSHSARYALEPMPMSEAGQALVDALLKTKGMTQVGLINSLGVRGETRAVPELTKLRQNPDNVVASAAATALGKSAALTRSRLWKELSKAPLAPSTLQ